ncbi:T9SS type A sorting domain-containing protein, partial [Reichenbachiella sp.]|uniref:T9SS type A sorting domain-containing protein n=3 Tax=Reichenbachiella sp. TaxID=2184521 RepID=UPI003299FFE9
TPGHIINNSNNLVIDGAITDSGNFTNNGTITGSGDLNLGAGSALNGTGSINGTDMGDITYSPGDDLDLSQPLPITLLYFDASVIKNCILLEWSTSAEINNDFFTIERSRNQRDWVVVGETAGSGNSIVTITYTYKDKVTAPGRWYYRLKQTDYDGQFEYFEAVEISLDSRFVESVVYYKESIVHLRNWSNSFWKIYDLKGQVMNEGVTDSFDTHQIWVDNLNAGMYLFQINQSAYRIWIR